ncbi:MAG: Peptidil-prolyl cis-trans isomerase [Acetothermia bacterium 64_32]|nr:MAG: Peptidil-prolyl cis-trans isomerase [Acetothermia bacterium 64_32]HAF70934.1 hypothetical protein [Candidatus Acetothermia bacterium]
MNRFFLRYQKAIIWTVVIGFLLGGIGLFTFQRFSPPPKGSAEEVVLVVEGRKFTRQNVQDAYENLVQYYTQLYQIFGQDFTEQLQGTAGAFNRRVYAAAAAEGLIRQALIQKEARSLHVSVSKAELDQAVEERYQSTLEQFGGDEEALKSYLSAQGLTLADYRRQLAASQEYRLLEEGVHKQVVGPIEPTEEELLTYYQEHQDRYQSQPERIRVAYIKVSDPELADQLLAQAQAPDSDFAALAAEYSESEEMETDWFSQGGSGLPQEVEEAAFELSQGQVTLVDALGAYYIVKLLDRRPPVIPPFEEIREKVEEDYISEEDSRRWGEWYEALRKAARVEVKDPLLEAFITYQSDVKSALDVLLAARGAISDLYLDYYIGRMYEQLYIDVGTQVAELKGKEELTEEEQARLKELSEKEEEYKRKALEHYLEFADTGEGDETFFNRVIALDPQNPQAHFRLAELYREQGLYVQADREYQQAIEAEPGFLAAYIGQGDAAMAMGLYGRAIECFREALGLQTGSRTIELRLAEAYLRDEQYDQAQPLLEELLEEEPEGVTVRVLMGDLLLAQGDPQGAIGHYKKAFEKNPTSEVQLKLALALLAAGRLEEAKEEYQDLIRRFPYRGEAYEGLGDVYRAQGDEERALEQYREALRRTYETAKKEVIAEKVVELAPDDIDTRFKLADYLKEQYKYDSAIRQYQEILAREGDNIYALMGLGDCYVPKTQYDTALSYYKKALALAGSQEMKLQVLGKIVACEEARAGPQGGLSQEGLEALWQRALIYRDLGRDEEAKQDLQRIYDTDPSFRAEELVPLLEELGGEVASPSEEPSP